MAATPHRVQYTEQAQTSQSFCSIHAARRSGLAVAAWAAALTTLAGMAPGATGAPDLSPTDQVQLVESRTPLEVYLQLLRTLYELLGGDPQDLDNLPLNAVTAMVCDLYDANGIPSGLTPAEQDELHQTAAALLTADPLSVLILGTRMTTVLTKIVLDVRVDGGL